MKGATIPVATIGIPRTSSAGFPACGFRGLSSPRFALLTANTELESSVNPQTKMFALQTCNNSEMRCPRAPKQLHRYGLTVRSFEIGDLLEHSPEAL
jgi:hypothetical protein